MYTANWFRWRRREVGGWGRHERETKISNEKLSLRDFFRLNSDTLPKKPMFFWVLTHLQVDTGVPEEHTVSIFIMTSFIIQTRFPVIMIGHVKKDNISRTSTSCCKMRHTYEVFDNKLIEKNLFRVRHEDNIKMDL